MFGSLRYFLALLVVYSHLQLPAPMGMNVGVVAVVVFYMLAGYVVSYLLSEIFTGQNRAWYFYQDRLWRIFPQYLLALFFSALVWWLFSPKSGFVSHDPDLADWLSNVFIVPLNYYMYTGQDGFTLLPPTWSLGAEIQFYVLMPLLVLSLLARRLILALSVAIFVLAQFGMLDSDIYGYRLLIGVLFIFYLGALIFQRRTRWLLLVGSAFLCYVASLFYLDIRANFVREVALGVLIGLLMLSWLSQVKVGSTVLRWVDKRLGYLSYGVFLFHFPVIWLVESLSLPTGGMHTVLVVLLSSMLAYIGYYWFELPLWQRFRSDYRG